MELDLDSGALTRPGRRPSTVTVSPATLRELRAAAAEIEAGGDQTFEGKSGSGEAHFTVRQGGKRATVSLIDMEGRWPQLYKRVLDLLVVS